VIVHSGKVNADGVAAKFAVIKWLEPNVHALLKPALAPTWVFRAGWV
jgi:hypothetical protein